MRRRLSTQVRPHRAIAVLLIIGGISAVPAIFLWVQDRWLVGFVTFAFVFVGLGWIAAQLFPFKCPKCNRKLGRAYVVAHQPGERVRVVCPTCEIRWDTGLDAPYDG